MSRMAAGLLLGLSGLLACFFGAPSGAAAQGGELGFWTVQSATQSVLAVRMLEPGLQQNRWAVVQARLATRVAPADGAMTARWRIAMETVYAVDCKRSGAALSVVHRVVNLAPMDASPKWVTVGADWTTGALALEALSFVSADELAEGERQLVGVYSADDPRPRLPQVWAVAAFACAVGSGQAAPAAAEWVERTGGAEAPTLWECTLRPRDGGAAQRLNVAVSRHPAAVRVGETWLSDGVVAEQYAGGTQGGWAIRLASNVGMLRVVARHDMFTIGTGRCVVVAASKPVAQPLGW